jgi:hypothetical protein
VQRRRTGPGPVLDQNQQFGWVEFQLSILLLSRQAGTPLEGIVLFADGRSGDWSRVPTTFASRSNADAPTTLSREIYANLVRTELALISRTCADRRWTMADRRWTMDDGRSTMADRRSATADIPY